MLPLIALKRKHKKRPSVRDKILFADHKSYRKETNERSVSCYHKSTKNESLLIKSQVEIEEILSADFGYNK